MSGLDRRTFLKGTGAAGVAGIAGCLGGGGGNSDATQVGMVYALGGLGDKAFNDMANQGIKDAKEELDVKYNNAEPSSQSDFKTLQRKFATSTDPDYDLVSCIGFAQASALTENAKEYTDQKFMIVDATVQKDNVASYVFKEEEGSFQVGYLAGMMTTRDFSHGDSSTKPGKKTVGFVGGKKNPLIKKFQAGYIAGVHHASEDIEVRSAYAGSWNDPGKGKEIALSMYDEGADIVYHAAGATGSGVFKAATERDRFAIGVDSDQSKSTDYSGVIMASMVKHVDTAVFECVENVTNDEFNGGSETALGLEAGGVEAVIGTDYEGDLPSEVTSNLEESKQAIIDGDIDVPKKPKNA